MSSNTRLARRAVLGTVSHVLGALITVLEFLFTGVMTPVHAIPATRPGIDAFGRAVVEINRWRLVTFLHYDDHLYEVPDRRRAHSYLSRRLVLGSIGLVILGLIALGVMSGAIMVWQVVNNRPIGGKSGNLARDGNQWYEIVGTSAIGLVLFFGAVWGLIGISILERTLADRYLGPSEAEVLRRRVTELADTRAAMVEAVNDERRRIERDLHDGVQQRLVALGMLLGRALRAKEPAHATTLVAQAHEESQQVLKDLRDVTWRVYPTALDKDGLHAALEGVAERASVPVELIYELRERPDLATETVLYFVASEAVTNALKHGNPWGIVITVTGQEDEIVVSIWDDGCGGADVNASRIRSRTR